MAKCPMSRDFLLGSAKSPGAWTDFMNYYAASRKNPPLGRFAMFPTHLICSTTGLPIRGALFVVCRYFLKNPNSPPRLGFSFALVDAGVG